MGIYFSLADIGVYGLVVATVAIAGSILGFRLNYFGARDLIDGSPENISLNIISQSCFYIINYILIASIVFLGAFIFHGDYDLYILSFIVILSALEHYAVVTNDVLIALKRPTAANLLLFVRAAFWPFLVIIFGYFFPEYRNVTFVLGFWCLGVLVSILIAGWLVRDMPWRNSLSVGADWKWIKTGIGVSLPIWVGGIGASAAQFAERFVVEGFLSRELVGVISFYGSFSNAVFSVIYGAVFTFSFPKMISFHKHRDGVGLKKEAITMTAQSIGVSSVISVLIGVFVPFVGELIGRPEFYQYSSVLWLMLLAICLRCASESLHYVLYARHEDRMIWLGGLAVVLPSIGLNLVFVPHFGLIGVGYSAVGTSLFYALWRFFCVLKSNYKTKIRGYYVS